MFLKKLSSHDEHVKMDFLRQRNWLLRHYTYSIMDLYS